MFFVCESCFRVSNSITYIGETCFPCTELCLPYWGYRERVWSISGPVLGLLCSQQKDLQEVFFFSLNKDLLYDEQNIKIIDPFRLNISYLWKMILCAFLSLILVLTCSCLYCGLNSRNVWWMWLQPSPSA